MAKPIVKLIMVKCYLQTGLTSINHFRDAPGAIITLNTNEVIIAVSNFTAEDTVFVFSSKT
jgi:hypothetical protein